MNFKVFAQFSMGTCIGTSLGVVTLPLLAWLLPVKTLGQYSLFNIVLGFFAILLPLGLDQSFVRVYHSVANKDILFAQVLFPGLLFSLLLCVPYSIALLFWMPYEQTAENLDILLALPAIAIISFLHKMYLSKLRMVGAGLQYSLVQVLPKTIFLVLIVCIYLLFGFQKVEILVASLAASILLTLAIIRLKNPLIIGVSRSVIFSSEVFSHIKFGVPLMLAGIVYWCLQSTDRLLINYFGSYEDLGIYSVGMSVAGVGVVLQTLFALVWTPQIFKWIEDGEYYEKIKETQRFVSNLALVVVGCTGLASGFLTVILPEKYAEIEFLVLLMINQPLIYVVSSATATGIQVSRKTHYALISVGIAAVSNLVLGVLLVPTWGLVGAALSSAVSFLVFMTIRAIISQNLWEIFPLKRIFIKMYGLVAIACCFQIWGEDANGLFTSIWVGLIIFPIFFEMPTIRKLLTLR